MNKRFRMPTYFIILLISLNNYIPAYTQDLMLLSHSGYIDLSGNYHVVGEFENTGTTAFQFIIVTVNFFDNENNQITSRFDLTMLDVLQPNRKTPFDIRLLDVTQSSNVDHYTISTSKSNSSPKSEGLEIANYQSYLDELGKKHILGDITNIQNSRAEDVKIVATFYDASENVIAASLTYIDPIESYLEPGETKQFEILLDEDRAPYADNFQLTSESIQYAGIPTIEPEPEPEPESKPDNRIPVMPLMALMGVSIITVFVILVRFTMTVQTRTRMG